MVHALQYILWEKKSIFADGIRTWKKIGKIWSAYKHGWTCPHINIEKIQDAQFEQQCGN